jgi:hypothetical protein
MQRLSVRCASRLHRPSALPALGCGLVQRRALSGAALPTHALVARYERHGTPAQVVRYSPAHDPLSLLSLSTQLTFVLSCRMVEEPLPAVGPNQVLVKLLAAPINPADLNMVRAPPPPPPPFIPL